MVNMEDFTPDQIRRLSNIMSDLAISARQMQDDSTDDFAKGYQACADFANRRLAKLNSELDSLKDLLGVS